MDDIAPKARRDGPASFVAVVEVITGSFGAIYALVAGLRPTFSMRSEEVGVTGNLNGWHLIAACLFAALAFAGYKLWRGTMIGYRLSLGLLGLQVVQVMLPRFQFKFVAPIGMGLGWRLDGERSGLFFSQLFGLGYRLGNESPLGQASYLSINGIALAACTYLAWSQLRGLGAAAQPGIAADRASPDR